MAMVCSLLENVICSRCKCALHTIKPNYTYTKTQIKHLKTPKPKRQTFKTLQTKENKGPRNPGISCLGGTLWTAMSWS